MSVAVQFVGVDAVLKAFDYKKIPAWAIFQGRSLLHKHEGSDIDESGEVLSEYLQMIASGGTTAIYTLKVYESGGKITEKTGCDGSFNFRLVNDDYRQRANEYYEGGRSKLIERLEAIEEKLLDNDEPEEPQSALGQLGNMLLADPTKLPVIINSLMSALQLLLPGTKPQQPPPQMQPVYNPPAQVPAPTYQANDYLQAATIGEINKPQEITPDNGIAADPLQEHVETLKRNDPKITEHLGKLARMSENDKGTFNYLLSILDSMP